MSSRWTHGFVRILCGISIFAGLSLLPLSQVLAATTQQPRPLTPDEASVYSQMKPGIAYELNPGDPHQRRMIAGHFSAAQLTQKSAPMLYKVLNNAANAGRAMPSGTLKAVAVVAGAPTDINIIDNFNVINARDNNNEITASGLSSVIKGTTQTTITIQLIDTTVTPNQVLAENTQQQLGGGTHFEVPVTAAVPAQHNVNAVATIAYTPNGSSTLETYVVSLAQMPLPTKACMTAPTYKSNAPACTNQQTIPMRLVGVCYNRSVNGAQNCDYSYPGPAYPTNFIFPASGNVDFSQGYASTLTGTANAILENPITGGGCQITTQAAIAAPNWTTNGTTLSWNLNPVSIADPNHCLNKFPNWTTANFYFDFEVQLNGTTPSGKPLYGRASFTSDASQAGQPGVYVIPQLDIQQGCFAAGTQVEMADGSERAIETFHADGAESVMSRTSALSKKSIARLVTSTTTGIEPYPILKVKAGPYVVYATRAHPFATPKGFVMAEDLKKGMVVLTKSGLRKIASITRGKTGVKVYNLRVGDRKSAEAGKNLFYANGFLVGDSLTQTYMIKSEQAKRVMDSAYLSRRLPKEWRTDLKTNLKLFKQKVAP